MQICHLTVRSSHGEKKARQVRNIPVRDCWKFTFAPEQTSISSETKTLEKIRRKKKILNFSGLSRSKFTGAATCKSHAEIDSQKQKPLCSIKPLSLYRLYPIDINALCTNSSVAFMGFISKGCLSRNLRV